MSQLQNLLDKFKSIADHPGKAKDSYLTAGKKVVLTVSYYTPDELIHSFGMIPMGVWGGDMELKVAKQYFPAFICSIMQSIVELGVRGDYAGASAIIVPSLCDSLKVLGENWKYAVPSIPFIPMTYPQNRKPVYGKEYTKKGYEKVIARLESVSGQKFDDAKLAQSIRVYNGHNALMRKIPNILGNHPEISATDRSAIFKSAYFMTKEEHSALVEELIVVLEQNTLGKDKIKLVTTGILADNPSLLEIIDENGFIIAADDVAAESRQYRIDAAEDTTALDALAGKYCSQDNCSVLYDAEKKRISLIIDTVKQTGSKAILVVLTKFCDPEEFDYPLLKKAADKANIPVALIEVDRQMQNLEQARTAIATLRDILAAT